MTAVTRCPLVVVLVGLACACAGCPGSSADKAGGRRQSKPVVLTMSDPDFGGRDVLEYVNAVERLSRSSIRVRVRSLLYGVPDYDRKVVRDVRAGRFAMGKIAARSLDVQGVSDFQALVAPLLIDSLLLERKVLQSDLPGRMLPSVGHLGLVGVAILPGEIRRPFGRSRALVAPSDYRGEMIGIRPSAVAEQAFDALGGTSRAYVPGHLAAFDGAELDSYTLETNHFDVPGSALTANVALWARPQVVVMQRKAYDALAPAQRDVLRRAGREALDAEIARLKADSTSETDVLCRRGHLRYVRATHADAAALRAAVRPVYAAIERNALTRLAIREIESLKRTSRPDTEPPCRATAAAAGVVGPRELQGVWTTTVTAAQGARAGASRAELANPNMWGHLRLAIRDGRFSGENERVNVGGGGRLDGSYSVAGDVITLHAVDGEVLRLRWSVYRGTLRFQKIAARDEITFLVAEPWRRVR
jgi:TRAP-type C4-dicarboxylate transport system substrate-binding protein